MKVEDFFRAGRERKEQRRRKQTEGEGRSSGCLTILWRSNSKWSEKGANAKRQAGQEMVIVLKRNYGIY
jgi:hypothetical protein